MNFNHKYLNDYNINNSNKFNQKVFALNNISTDFSKTAKVLNNNFINQRNVHTNTNIQNNNYLYDKKLFKDVKLYNIIKPTKYIKKRNNSNSSNHNNFVESSLTEGNFNNNSKKYISIFNSNPFKLNNRNTKPQKNYYSNNNNNIKIKKANGNMNALLHNSNSFKLSTKSKSNAGFIKNPQFQNLIKHAREKSSFNHNNNTKIFSTIGLSNNLSMKNIKNHSSFSPNNKKLLNSRIITNNISSNNKLSNSVPKKI